MDDFLPLPLKHTYKGFKYVQLIRTGSFAIYEQTISESRTAFEVIKIKKVQKKVIAGKVIPAHEQWPSDIRAGITLWTYTNLKSAINKFITLMEI